MQCNIFRNVPAFKNSLYSLNRLIVILWHYIEKGEGIQNHLELHFYLQSLKQVKQHTLRRQEVGAVVCFVAVDVP